MDYFVQRLVLATVFKEILYLLNNKLINLKFLVSEIVSLDCFLPLDRVSYYDLLLFSSDIICCLFIF